MEIPANGLRLNLGCGRHVLDGWFNIDVEASPLSSRAPDMISDARRIDLPDGCASEIMAIHLWEHFYRWECDEVVVEWGRLLRHGGKLVLEMPDLFKFCQNILEERKRGGKHLDQLGMWGLYGDQREKNPLMVHRWGWTYKTLALFLKENGFMDTEEKITQWHPAGRQHRDFRIEATRV